MYNLLTTSRRLRKIRRNERNSGSLCSAAARDPESALAEIGPAEARERDPRLRRAVEKTRANPRDRRPTDPGQRPRR